MFVNLGVGSISVTVLTWLFGVDYKVIDLKSGVGTAPGVPDSVF